MPVISFANSKGGSGKTTSALILACELAEGTDVVLIDADPRRPLTAWAKLPGKPERLTVVRSGGERTILDEINEHSTRVPFVIVDLEGTASKLASYAFSQSDLVMVPTQESQQDAAAAIETITELKRDARAMRREIPVALVFTRAKVVAKGRTARAISKQLREFDGLHVLKTELAEREAYTSIFNIGGGIRQLDPNEVNGIDKAVDNAVAYAAEIINLLGAK